METQEGELLWEPTPQAVRDANVSRFMAWVEVTRQQSFTSYEELWQWSVREPAAFWSAVWDFFEVAGSFGTGPVLEGEMPDHRWFSGTTLNHAANMLRSEDPSRPAVVFRNEAGARRELTHGELTEEVARVRRGLVKLGVEKGDRVAAYVPNIPEALIAFLATASLGAIWSSCSPDFGSPSVVDRFQQIEPKVLVAVDGYHYNGKAFDRTDTVGEIAAKLPTLETTIWIPYLGEKELLGLGWGSLRSEQAALEFEAVPFDHPLWVLYSSGTTGLPKPIVHGHGGVVLEHLKSLTFHHDLGSGDVFFWFTTTGWMMWNYLIGGLMTGSTVVLYDGAPTRLWELAAEESVTYFGVGAPFLIDSMRKGLSPEGLDALRGIGSTGSPLPPEAFKWVYDSVKDDVQLGSYSGGTDVATGFVGPVPLLPVRAGVISCRCLGCRVEAFDASGDPVTDEVGELVITAPMPSMPVMFWNDPDGSRYRESYFADYANIWRHGDWIKIRPDGGCIIYGRSDSTLNRGGIRMGTSEFYRVVERFEEIADSLVIDTGRLGEEGRLILFVQLAPDAEFDEKAVKAALRSELSPRHVPDEIRVVPGIPRTLSGKKLEVPVRKIFLGTAVEKAANPDAMANPEVLDHFSP